MMSIIIVIIVTFFIVIIEVPKLFRNRRIKELFMFFILVFIGLALNIANSLHMKLPSPIDLINYIYTPIGNIISKFLE